MKEERWKKIETLFEEAIGRDTSERDAFLERACGDDPTLKREVESLLAHHQPTGRFIPTLAHDAARLLPQDRLFSSGSARFIPGTVLANRYRIIALLGKGGMGEVYRADDLKLSQSVALKFLPEKLAQDRNMLERFHREVRIARQISHPNICRVFDIGEVEDQHFLSMEYIDGEDLATLLRRIGRLPSDKAVEIASQLCGGVRAAHQEGVLHRDLKPANVMIDGRGRAKITDFGLAGLSDEFKGNEVRAGTPAYMAPEQLAGKEVTVKSDIYSLGLVLYEIFTGKKAFEASTLEDIIKQRETSAPPSLSDHVKEIDPLVERVILRCLERDPAGRPASAAQVAAALPGADPLAAAIAAGETPSPEMVAAAPKEGALRPAAAIACLSAIIILLAFFVIASGKYSLQNRAPFSKPPEALQERAISVLNKLGYAEQPLDSKFGFDMDGGYLQYLKDRNSLRDLFDKPLNAQPGIFSFWYRQSPRYLQALSRDTVTPSDPPMDVSNMASVILDTQGQLIELNAVPPQIDDGPSAATSPDWAILFSEAGLNIANFKNAESVWVPPAGYDMRAAWEGAYPNQPDIPMRVEAAAYRGKPVYFQIIPPWKKPLRQQEAAPVSGRMAAGAIIALTFAAGLIAAILIARRNIKMGRGDRKGAFKLALFVFSAAMIGLLLRADHVPTLDGELNILSETIAWALFEAALLWVVYVALEPHVRRRWPRLIISWSRLLAGGFRDPMVGRDILIGGLLGLGHTLAIYSISIIPVWIGLNPGSVVAEIPFPRGTQTSLAIFFGDMLPKSLVVGLGFLFLILLFYVWLKKQWLAALLLWLLSFAVECLAFVFNSPWPAWIGMVLIATVAVVTAVRFGLLAMTAFQLFFFLSFHSPLTSNLSAWHAGQTIFPLLILLALSAYGFYTSLAGQPLFRSGVLQD
jgi:eukaryotic-like serine/threonine-protein kinase